MTRWRDDPELKFEGNIWTGRAALGFVAGSPCWDGLLMLEINYSRRERVARRTSPAAEQLIRCCC